MPYKLLPEQSNQESSGQSLIRHALRSTARGAESVLGVPGDVGQVLKSAFNPATEPIIPGTGLLPEDQRQQVQQFWQQQQFPGSSAQLREVTKELTGEYLEPQGSGEAFFDEVISDFAPMLVPGSVAKGKIPGLKTIAGTAGKSILGNLASWGAESLGAGPLGQTGAKLGTFALANTIGGRSALAKQMKSQYDLAQQASQNASIDAKKLRQSTNKLIKEVSIGDKVDKNFILERLDAVKNAAKKNHISVSDLWELKRNMNEQFKIAPYKARPYVERIIGELNQELQNYGKRNPAFGNSFNQAEDIFKGLNASSEIGNFLKRNPTIANSISSPVVKTLLGGAGLGVGLKVGLPTAAALVGGTGLGVRTAERAFNLLKRPAARNYYKEAVKAGLRNDTSAFARNIANLDKIASKSEPKKSNTYKLLPI